ncbi:type IX secretion system sortase PorU [Flavobacteriales bacterium]|nr:type IX secretion system sortase PorU [Flavobacteriales bacterium]
MHHIVVAQQNSVLSSGDFYKISVENDGVYQLTYSDFQQLNISTNNLDISSIKVYGNGGGMLPNLNSDFRYSDLQENAIYIYDNNNNGVFNSEDYLLFFGQSSNEWKFDSIQNIFDYSEHLYSDKNYYFVTIDESSPGKRIGEKQNLPNFSKTITSFNDFQVHEINSENLIQSGREWYGERFGIIDKYSFEFNFSNLITSHPINIKTSVAARSLNQSTFNIKANNNFVANVNVAKIVYDYATPYAFTGLNSSQFNSTSDQINIDVEYNYSENNAIGWLNYLQLNSRRALKITNNNLHFRDIQFLYSDEVGKYIISNATSNTQVWDVSDILNVKKLPINLVGNEISFLDSLSNLNTYYAFNSVFQKAELIGKIENQNLHNFGSEIEYVIITHPNFLSAANRLAEFHENEDNLVSRVVIPQQIYNEFSSGMQDASAIRDFLRMLYKRPNSQLKYALLFGDGSYDNKSRIPNNTNFIPTFQSEHSTDPTKSYVTDDYYALLDDSDGDFVNDLIDVGLGRLPVKTLSEANDMVNKIEDYYSTDALGDWRNSVAFVADDGDQKDGNMFMTQANNHANYIDTNFQNINLNKIFLDSYLQESTPGGPRSPQAQNAINRVLDNGAFLVNYTGHGGPLGWSQERILEVDQIKSWDNKNKLPLFMTATCKFSCFDDPAKVSAGEYLLLNDNGGAIALLTTTRLVYAFPNYSLNTNFIDVLFEKYNGEHPRLGDLYKQTKVLSGSGANTRNFILLGDPAISLSYPKYNITTSSIPDTIKALQEVTIIGEVREDNGNILTNFNGVVFPTVYDKEVISVTLGQESCSPMPFRNQNNIIYKGTASVTSGQFSFSFVVPKDIENNYARGKISYYASENSGDDASGSDDSFVIGGTAENIDYDYTGPEISLYINNRNFLTGGLTNNSPVLLADIIDFSGINTVGNGIGHDITAILDNNFSNPFILNEYYKSNLNSYSEGVVEFPFENLEDGMHTLTLKVWDVFNNSSESSVDFYVSNDEIISVSEFLNYPNPFTNSTEFYFQLNQSDQLIDVNIDIFSMTGQHIDNLKQSFFNNGFRVGPINWNINNKSGGSVSPGLYIANLSVEMENGLFETKSIRIAITP